MNGIGLEPGILYSMRKTHNISDLPSFLKYYFPMRATGEIFSSMFYKLSVSDTVIGEYQDASVGKTCVPSTDKVKGQDDFASFNVFWFVDCNFVVDDAGVKIPTCIEGQSGFKRTGKVQVGVLTPPLYYGIEKTADGEIWHLSDTKHPGLVLMPHCKDNFGKPMPYGIVPKYYAGRIDGLLYGSSGLPVENFLSYMSLHTEVQKLGAGYMGAGSERSAYLETMLRIKYARSSSQAVFRGCTDYNFQHAAAKPSSGNYIVLTKAQASKFYVGSTVSIGEAGANTDIDRQKDYMRNLADKVKITKIEDEDETYSRIYVDAPTFAATTTTYISTMPLHSGQTDVVLGNDGQLANDGRHSFKLQGVEEGIGAYFISANEVMNKETATKTVFYARGSAPYSTDLESIRNSWKEIGSFESENSADTWIGEIDMDMETGAEVIRTIGSGSNSGAGDKYYFGSNGTGLREMLKRGGLGGGSDGGLSCGNGWDGLDWASWRIAGCIS